MIPVLTTDRLTLRALKARDLAPYTAYYTGDRTGGVGGPLPAHKVFERFCAMIGHWQVRGFGRFGICLDPGAPAIGHVGPMQLDDGAPEMTWTLWAAKHEGKGIATEAARAVLTHLFGAGWSRLLAHVEPDNARSHAVARRLGGTPTGADAPSWAPLSTQYQFTPEALT
ncbi:MAG: GNAT family N-acetyltransferase [Pseudomonadota bacterium]